MFIEHLKKTEKSLFVFFLIVSASIVGYLNLTAESPYDCGDGVQHYLIARYSWEHPHLFLDLWGKPLFTLFASPFAQIGWKGIVVFQLICGIISSIFGFLIAKKLEFKASYLVPVFIFFSPIYFNVINSGLTEIFFSCLLIASLWFFVDKKFTTSVILFSFLPYARIEGLFLMPLITLALFFRHQVKLLPLLLVGTLVITLIGLTYYKDWLWVIHKNYRAGEDYGIKGSFFHYFRQYKLIFGKWHAILFLISFVILLFKRGSKYFIELLVLFFGSVCVIFFAHTLFNWMRGINSNLGMLRFMATFIPISSVCSLLSFELIHKLLSKKIFFILFQTIIFYLLCNQPFNPYTYPYQPNDEIKVIQHSLIFIKKLNPENKKIYYQHPLFAFFLEFDPFDSHKSIKFYSGTFQEYSLIPDSSIILWDSHFGPQEGETPINSIIKNPNYHLQKVFKHFSTNFTIAIFIKHSNTNYSVKADTEYVFTLKESKIEKIEDFKNFNVSNQHPLQNDRFYFSPPYSICFSNDNEFGPLIFDRKSTNDWFKGFSTLINVYPMEKMNKVILVTHIIDTTNNETIYWNGNDLPDTLKLNEWNHIKINVTINYSLKPNEKASVYIWNFGRKKFCIDDIHFTYYYIRQK